MSASTSALGPLLVIAVVLAGLALVLRWAFGSGYGRDGATPVARRPDHGLLVLIATVSTPETARALRAVLSDAGIRSTAHTSVPHRTDVLVFPGDADRARTLAASFPG